MSGESKEQLVEKVKELLDISYRWCSSQDDLEKAVIGLINTYGKNIVLAAREEIGI